MSVSCTERRIRRCLEGGSLTHAERSISVADASFRGMAWSAAALIVGQIAAVTSMIVSGFYLNAEQFRVAGLALAVASMASSARAAGVRQYLIHHRADYANLCRPALRLALLIAAAIAALLLASAHWMEGALAAPDLAPMIVVVAASMLPGVPGRVYGAKLSIGLDFRATQSVLMKVQLARQLSVIILLLCGAGAMSLIVPILIAEVLDWMLTRRAAGPLPAQTKVAKWSDCRQVLAASRWITLSVVGVVLAENLDRFAVECILGGVELGYYYFAYRLTVGLYRLASRGFQNIMTPSFAMIQAEGDARQGAAFLRAASSATLVAGGAAGLLAILMPPMIALVWAEKWVASSSLACVIALSFGGRALVPLSSALVNAKGLWRLSATAQLLDGMLVGFAAAFGAMFGEVFCAAVMVSAYRFLSGLGSSMLAARQVGLRNSSVLQSVAGPSIFYLVAGAGALATQYTLGGLAGVVCAALQFLLTTAVFAWTVQRRTCVELARLGAATLARRSQRNGGSSRG